MLATLYGKALDSRAPDPVLGDRYAEESVRRIEYDFATTGMTPTTAARVALRSRQLDDWTRDFIGAPLEATVLHLACGLDARALRLHPPASVRWIDLDYPHVIELRERLLPVPTGDYRTVAASVTG